MIGKLKLGDIILGQRGTRKVTGKIIKIWPGSVVIENRKNDDERIVIDADMILKLFKPKKDEKL